MSELKPCPFCGATDVRVKCIEEFTYSAKCRQCDALGPDGPSRESAIGRWNDCTARSFAPTETLRDEFAMAALSGLLAGRSEAGCDPYGHAIEAYQCADAMMKEREKADD